MNSPKTIGYVYINTETLQYIALRQASFTHDSANLIPTESVNNITDAYVFKKPLSDRVYNNAVLIELENPAVKQLEVTVTRTIEINE